MTILDTREVQSQSTRRHGRCVRPRATAARRPRVRRGPAGAPCGYRGTGVLMSRASHRRRPITPATTVILALVAAAITVWLGLVAQFGGVIGMPRRRCRTGSRWCRSRRARRCSRWRSGWRPTRRSAQVVEQIRELNQLESAAVDAGQTLIAPVG